jgi:hypothetical protein
MEMVAHPMGQGFVLHLPSSGLHKYHSPDRGDSFPFEFEQRTSSTFVLLIPKYVYSLHQTCYKRKEKKSLTRCDRLSILIHKWITRLQQIILKHI